MQFSSVKQEDKTNKLGGFKRMNDTICVFDSDLIYTHKKRNKKEKRRINFSDLIFFVFFTINMRLKLLLFLKP